METISIEADELLSKYNPFWNIVRNKEMKIESGKYYRTRDGRKVGPMVRLKQGYVEKSGIRIDPNTNFDWYNDGNYQMNKEVPNDLISEWIEPNLSPVRTVTRKEIVPGNFGCVNIIKDKNNIWVSVSLTERPENWRAAAATLIELADALEDN